MKGFTSLRRLCWPQVNFSRVSGSAGSQGQYESFATRRVGCEEGMTGHAGAAVNRPQRAAPAPAHAIRGASRKYFAVVSTLIPLRAAGRRSLSMNKYKLSTLSRGQGVLPCSGLRGWLGGSVVVDIARDSRASARDQPLQLNTVEKTRGQKQPLCSGSCRLTVVQQGATFGHKQSFDSTTPTCISVKGGRCTNSRMRECRWLVEPPANVGTIDNLIKRSAPPQQRGSAKSPDKGGVTDRFPNTLARTHKPDSTDESLFHPVGSDDLARPDDLHARSAGPERLA